MFKKLLIVFVLVLVGSKGAFAQTATDSAKVAVVPELSPKEQSKLQKKIRTVLETKNWIVAN